MIKTDAELKKIQQASGVIIDGYRKADDAEYLVNYPKEVEGITPRMQGGFSKKRFNGELIYVPTGEVRKEIEALT